MHCLLPGVRVRAPDPYATAFSTRTSEAPFAGYGGQSVFFDSLIILRHFLFLVEK